MTSMLLVPALLGACSQPGSVDDEVTPPTTASPDTAPDTTPSPEPNASEDKSFSTCANSEEGYEVRYPAGWHVNDPETGGHCLVFHPEPFELQPGTEIPTRLAIVTRVEPVAMERMLQGDHGSEELSRRETTVAGLPAMVIEARATEDAPLEEPGTLSYRYLVRLGPERTLVARTTDRGDVPYEDKRRVLDDMVATLRIFDPEA